MSVKKLECASFFMAVIPNDKIIVRGHVLYRDEAGKVSTVKEFAGEFSSIETTMKWIQSILTVESDN